MSWDLSACNSNAHGLTNSTGTQNKLQLEWGQGVGLFICGTQYEARPDARNLIRTLNQTTSIVKFAIQAT